MIEVAPRVLVGAWGGADLIIPSTPTVQFQQYPTTIEASNTEVVTASYVFIRTGDLTGTTSVEWEATGTMTAADYVDGQALAGVIAFDPGVELAAVNLLIRAAALGTPDKSLIFSIFNPDGGRIGGPTSVTALVRMPTSGPIVIIRPDAFSVVQGTVTTFDVLANDDPQRPELTITALGSIARGSAIRISGNRAIAYTATLEGGFAGTFSFTYTARDSVTGEVGTGTVTVTITEPFAIRPDQITIARGQSFLLSPLANDSPSSGLELVSFTAPARGTTSPVPGESKIIYRAPGSGSGYTGPDNFAYTARRTTTGEIASAAVNVTVRAPSSLPFGTTGPNSGIPWWSGTAQLGKELEGIRSRESDSVTMFGQWGKEGTIQDGWDDLAGGTLTAGNVKLDGCFAGFRGRNDFPNEWITNPQVTPIWSYHALPAKVDDDNLPLLRSYYNNIADGDYDDDVYLPMMEKLNRIMLFYGYEFVVARIMHESNGSHYSHSVNGQYPEFIAAWRHVATIFRNNIGSGLSVYTDWNCAKNPVNSISPEHYPGDSFVDIISVDYYDRGMSPKITSLAAFNQVALQSKGGRSPTYNIPGLYGLTTYLNFAKSRGKLLGVSEWGVMDPALHSGGGGDNPEFINGMFQFFKNNAQSIAYENYFGQGDSRLSNHPNSRAKYASLWKTA